MTLYINTALYNKIIIYISERDKMITKKSFSAPQHQAERLLVEIDKLLKKNNIKLKDIDSIKVANKGESFTSLRIGVVIANALAYALGINIQTEENKRVKGNVVKPIYDREPAIGKKKT